ARALARGQGPPRCWRPAGSPLSPTLGSTRAHRTEKIAPDATPLDRSWTASHESPGEPAGATGAGLCGLRQPGTARRAARRGLAWHARAFLARPGPARRAAHALHFGLHAGELRRRRPAAPDADRRLARALVSRYGSESPGLRLGAGLARRGRVRARRRA